MKPTAQRGKKTLSGWIGPTSPTGTTNQGGVVGL
jgi:hypothetical protein